MQDWTGRGQAAGGGKKKTKNKATTEKQKSEQSVKEIRILQNETRIQANKRWKKKKEKNDAAILQNMKIKMTSKHQAKELIKTHKRTRLADKLSTKGTTVPSDYTPLLRADRRSS